MIEDYVYQHPWLSKVIAFFVLSPTVFGSLWVFLDPLDPFGVKILEGLGIWGYIGLLIVSSAISIAVIILSIRKILIRLPRVETELRRVADLKPEFFRKGGPIWADFEEGFVCRRAEIDEITRKLNEKHQHVIVGAPASGKSVLLKNIGFELRNSRYRKFFKYRVFYVNCKTKSEEQISEYFEEVLRVDSARVLIIIDDYHLKRESCEDFLERCENQRIEKTKVLIGTRPIDKGGRKEALRIDDLTETDETRTELTSENVSQNIISEYLEHLKQQRQLSLSNEDMEQYSTLFSEYEMDLWNLASVLRAFDPNKGTVAIDDVYKEIRREIEDMKAEDIFLPLSMLNRLEIPVETHFLTDREYGLGIEKRRINDLISRSEIVVVEGMGPKEEDGLVFHHSSIARLIYRTYQNTGLGRDLEERNSEERFLLNYIVHSDFLYYLDTFLYAIVPEYRYDAEDFGDLLRRVIYQHLLDHGLREKIHKVAQYIVDGDRDLYEVKWYWDLYLVELPMQFAAKLADELSFDRLVGKINEADRVREITELLNTVPVHARDRIIVQMDLGKLRARIRSSETGTEGSGNMPELLLYGKCYVAMAYDDDDVASELLETIKCILLEMDSYIEEDDETALSSEAVAELMHVVVGEQASYGRHHDYAAIDRLLDSIEGVIQEARTPSLVDPSDRDYGYGPMGEWNDRQLYEDLEALFEDKEFLARTLRRLGVDLESLNEEDDE